MGKPVKEALTGNRLSWRSGVVIVLAGFLFTVLFSVGMTSGANSGSAPNENRFRNDTGDEEIEALLQQFDAYAEETFNKSIVPGMAVALVDNDTIIYKRCFGVKNVTTLEPVTPDTRFYLASISKTFTSGTIASLVGDKELSWDDRVSGIDSGFNLSDPWITERVTFRDLLSHRTGLPEYAGDELSELDFNRSEILKKIRLIPLTGEFRSSYAYSNIGITMAAEAAAKKARMSWDDLIHERIFVPAGLKNTSSRFADYISAENHADTYPTDNGTLKPGTILNNDVNTPAGGVSSTLDDMARYLLLQLNEGKIDGKQVIASDALLETHKPQNIRNSSYSNLSAYGLGWEIYLNNGRYRVEHGGDLSNGVSTFIVFYPEEKRGIVVLTNGFPEGHVLKKAIIKAWDDIFSTGAVQKDWYTVFTNQLAEQMKPGTSVISPLQPLPSAPQGAGLSWPLTAYNGSYKQDYYGDAHLEINGTGLKAYIGPGTKPLTLEPYDKNTFRDQESGSGVNFTVDDRGKATAVNFTVFKKPWNNGTFFRVSP